MNATFEFLLRGLAVSVVGALCLLLARRQSAAVRHAIAFACLAAMFLVPLCQGVSIPVKAESPVAVHLFEAKGTTPARMVNSYLPPIQRPFGTTSINVFPIWALGASLLALRVLIGLAIAGRWWSRASRGPEPDVRMSPATKIPLALPWGILVPEGEPDPMALAHERAHFVRRDVATQLISTLVVALHWANPLAWWLLSRQRKLAELAADDAVIRSGHEPSQYAELLLRFAKEARGRALVVAAPIVRKSDVRARIESILDSRVRRTPLTRRALVACVLGALSVAILAGATTRPARTSDDQKDPNWTGRTPQDGDPTNGFVAVARNTRVVTLERLVQLVPGKPALNWSPSGQLLPDEPNAPYRQAKWSGELRDKVQVVFKLKLSSLYGEPTAAAQSPKSQDLFRGETTYGGGGTFVSKGESTVVALMKWEGAGDRASIGFSFADGPWSSLVSGGVRAQLPVGSPTSAIWESLTPLADHGVKAVVVNYGFTGTDERAVFTDVDGRETIGDWSSFESKTNREQIEVTARIPIERLATFAFQWRQPYHVDFHNVAIRPPKQ